MRQHQISKKYVQLSVLNLIILLLTCFSCYYAQSENYKSPIKVERSGENFIEVETEIANYLFSLEGGNVRSIFLYFASYGTKQAELVSSTTTDPETLNRSYLQQGSFPGQLVIGDSTDNDVNYQVSYPEETRYDVLPLTLTGTMNGLKIVKTFYIYNRPNYTISVETKITNTSQEAKDFSQGIKLLVGTRRSRESAENVNYLSDPQTKYIFDGKVSNGIFAPGSYSTFGGAGFVGSNLVLFAKPGGVTSNSSDSSTIFPVYSKNSLYINLNQSSLSTQDTVEEKLSIYAGRRRHVLLSDVGLGAIDDTGFFSKLLVPVLQFLRKLYEITGNYGWAIILFTILIRVLLYPLMRNMYRSMAKMQEMQPRLKEIQEKYKDDRQKQQEKMMEMYREEGVNPMGGCLPMFIQLPILILLWRAILYSAESIHLSPGFLWLNDLSLHDPYYILVALTVGAMILQQQFMQTPQSGGGQSKWIGLVFPLFMGVMLHNFPAGLWLYYFLTTFFQLGQQYFINWEMEKSRAEEEQPA